MSVGVRSEGGQAIVSVDGDDVAVFDPSDLPVFNGVDVIESGNDGSGAYYIRFADGTQICHVYSARSPLSFTVNIGGSIYRNSSSAFTGAWPAEFAAGTTPTITGVTAQLSAASTDAVFYAYAIHDAGASGWRGYFFHLNGGADADVAAFITAIGRWF